MVLSHMQRPTHHVETWSDICDYPCTTVRIFWREGSENTRTIERQDILVMQIYPIQQFTFESLEIRGGEISKGCRNGQQSSNLERLRWRCLGFKHFQSHLQRVTSAG